MKETAWMQGEHPKHRGISDPSRLGTVERYFVEIMDIPRLQQRIQCFIFTRTFTATVQRVSAYPISLNLRLFSPSERHQGVQTNFVSFVEEMSG